MSFALLTYAERTMKRQILPTFRPIVTTLVSKGGGGGEEGDGKGMEVAERVVCGVITYFYTNYLAATFQVRNERLLLISHCQ